MGVFGNDAKDEGRGGREGREEERSSNGIL